MILIYFSLSYIFPFEKQYPFCQEILHIFEYNSYQNAFKSRFVMSQLFLESFTSGNCLSISVLARNRLFTALLFGFNTITFISIVFIVLSHYIQNLSILNYTLLGFSLFSIVINIFLFQPLQASLSKKMPTFLD